MQVPLLRGSTQGLFWLSLGSSIRNTSSSIHLTYKQPRHNLFFSRDKQQNRCSQLSCGWLQRGEQHLPCHYGIHREQGCARKDELIVKIIERAFKGINTIQSPGWIQMCKCQQQGTSPPPKGFSLCSFLLIRPWFYPFFVSLCHPPVPELSILECVVLHKQPRKRHKAAGMIQRSYRQWKQGQGITEVFILAKEEVTSRANPSSHRYSSLPAWLMQSRAGSCMHEPLIHTFLACWRLCTPWITFSTTPHSQVLWCQITTGGGTALFLFASKTPLPPQGNPSQHSLLGETVRDLLWHVFLSWPSHNTNIVLCHLQRHWRWPTASFWSINQWHKFVTDPSHGGPSCHITSSFPWHHPDPQPTQIPPKFRLNRNTLLSADAHPTGKTSSEHSSGNSFLVMISKLSYHSLVPGLGHTSYCHSLKQDVPWPPFPSSLIHTEQVSAQLMHELRAGTA